VNVKLLYYCGNLDMPRSVEPKPPEVDAPLRGAKDREEKCRERQCQPAKAWLQTAFYGATHLMT